ncbi:sialate O-acetylesterase [Sphingobacterium alkalisoli]|uniref:Sialate O-acetylesterase n=1 Tax=Sphingobacterium alkalisoli TaxID=1874115 RepID=A0A4U0H4V3_9SPHI|nr:sialate O-acetylesterase [Sphingobacterium alkalisoli]TJY66596.1 sialate O-acetylesterase [Sphingobacterium alkalisoli]GGH15428.1 9-O-acetylesterase [Sphingobacterium alkalisoli]
MMNKLVLVLLLVTQSAVAAVRLPALIGDRMVLQRDIELKIWGWANVDEKVTVRFQGKYYYTEAGSDGKWMVTLPPKKAGGPYVMEINELAIRDVLIGDVWLCSGQSNMETPIERLVEQFPEIDVSNNHMIRYFKVPTQNTVEAIKEDIPRGGVWRSGIASDVMNWTALAYFYAQESYLHNGVPVGMLVSSLGGSAIESWISQEHLKEFPQLLVDQVALDSLRLIQSDKGAENWIKREWNDADWCTANVPGDWRRQGIEVRGVVYFRKEFEMPARMEGRHAKLYMGTMVDSDSVFINGHFVGATSYMYPPRKYHIPAGVLRAGKNNVTVRLRANSGNGSFVEDKIYRVKADDVEVDLTGEWKYKVGIDLAKAKRLSERLQRVKSAGSGLYNGMIYPLRDYGVKGVIWYQGESNTGQPQRYRAYLKTLINSWRTLLHQPNLPFLLVQLPNYMAKQDLPSESGWAGVREAQFKIAQEVAHTALAVTYDVGEWNDIHPLNKKDIAKRLFLGARKVAYGEHIVSDGPRYKNMEMEGNKIILSFTEVGGGLRSKGGAPLRHFAIAGEDKKFVWADAVIKGNTVVVSHPLVKPVAVRYGWSDNPEDANLINKEGLLASPFRTDNW